MAASDLPTDGNPDPTPSQPSSQTPSPPQPVSIQIPRPDASFYTWRNFFGILTGSATDEERRNYFFYRDSIREESDCRRCEDYRDYLLKYSPLIRFLTSEIAALGPPLNADNIRCRRCLLPQSGGFDPAHGLLLCANHLRNRGHAEDTLAHELVHAYDHVRFRLDYADLRHAACTEIRASTLSGECRFTREFFTRHQRRLTGQLQDCVRRRAVLSLMNRPACRDQPHAERVVDEVWESCFRDTRPFDEIYR